ncbi:hypothetical protein DRQ50_11705 [bacterium]|nr:MAG: hypothetical protein DRQ50_11705 [bacterium]
MMDSKGQLLSVGDKVTVNFMDKEEAKKERVGYEPEMDKYETGVHRVKTIQHDYGGLYLTLCNGYEEEYIFLSKWVTRAMSDTDFVDAGLTNTSEGVEEALRRMMKGEVFYDRPVEGIAYMFIADCAPDPFRCIDLCVPGDRGAKLISFDTITTWKVKGNWVDKVLAGTPAWCRVWDEGGEVGLQKISRYFEGGTSPYGIFPYKVWNYAEPVPLKTAERIEWLLLETNPKGEGNESPTNRD